MFNDERNEQGGGGEVSIESNWRFSYLHAEKGHRPRVRYTDGKDELVRCNFRKDQKRKRCET